MQDEIAETGALAAARRGLNRASGALEAEVLGSVFIGAALHRQIACAGAWS